ncbi:MAG TPA: gamma-glutamyltransferase, partial [Blastocatellia bacterium]|nr:gamma-glutamyltransferase [Blastocatellia bacterium]
ILRLVYYDAKTKRVYSLNAPWKSYADETDPKTIPVDDMGPLPNAPKPTEGAEGRKTLVPGFMAGIEAMHTRLGRLPFSDLFQPAIWYAEHGVHLTPGLVGPFVMRRKYLSRTSAGMRFMAQAGGEFPTAGENFVQTDLANTLREVARDGAKYMYTGKWASDYVDAVRAAGGKATLDDLASYRPIWEEPLRSSFLGNTVFSAGKTSDGSRQILEALNVVEELKLEKDRPYFEDPKAMKDLSQALQLVQVERFGAAYIQQLARLNAGRLSPEALITKEHGRVLASMIESAPEASLEDSAPAGTPAPNHSDSIVAVDRWGNVAAVVHSINTLWWGTTGIVVGGIPIPDAAGFQQSLLGSLKPGSLVPDAMAPVVVVRNRHPVFAAGTIGESLVPETVRVLMGALGNHLDNAALIAAPPLLANFSPWLKGETLAQRALVIPAGAYSQDLLGGLRAEGLRVEEQGRLEVSTIKGTAVFLKMGHGRHMATSAEAPGVWDFGAAY